MHLSLPRAESASLLLESGGRLHFLTQPSEGVRGWNACGDFDQRSQGAPQPVRPALLALDAVIQFRLGQRPAPGQGLVIKSWFVNLASIGQGF